MKKDAQQATVRGPRDPSQERNSSLHLPQHLESCLLLSWHPRVTRSLEMPRFHSHRRLFCLSRQKSGDESAAGERVLDGVCVPAHPLTKLPRKPRRLPVSRGNILHVRPDGFSPRVLRVCTETTAAGVSRDESLLFFASSSLFLSSFVFVRLPASSAQRPRFARYRHYVLPRRACLGLFLAFFRQ